MPKNNDAKNWFSILAFTAIVAAVFVLLQRYFQQLQNSKEDEFISDEGKKILQDKNKREKLNLAVEQFKESGSWDGLKEI